MTKVVLLNSSKTQRDPCGSLDLVTLSTSRSLALAQLTWTEVELLVNNRPDKENLVD